MHSVIDYYTSFGEREWSRLDREPLEFLVNMHYIQKYLPRTGKVLDNGAGPGKYSIYLAEKGYEITLTDLTPELVKIAKQKADHFHIHHKFDGFHITDAQDLSRFNNNSFDAALMMGPMYHLEEKNARIKAIQELHRVTKNEGIVFVAFRSRTNHTLLSLLAPEHWKPNNQIDTIRAFLNTGVFHHSDEGRFTGAYFFNTEEIAPFMEEKGFKTIDIIGSTNIGTLLKDEHWNYWKNKGDEELEKLISLLIFLANDPALLGISSHLLYIGKKL